MAGVAHRSTSLGTPREGWEGADALRTTGLTAVALATLALGFALLVLPGLHTAPEIPTVLFAIALAMLVVTLLLSRGERTDSSHVVPAEAPETARKTYPVTPGPVRAPTPAAFEAARPGVPGRGSAWRILSLPAEPGDETWLSWLPRESRRLGPDASSVGSGVVTSPGRAGNLVAFPVRDYFGGALPRAARGAMAPLPPRAKGRGLVGDEDRTALSAPRAAPFSEEELDQMFPPTGRRGSVFLAAAPDRIGGHSPWATPATVADQSVEIPDEPSDFSDREAGPEIGEEISFAGHRWVDQNPRTSKRSDDVAAHGDLAWPPAGRAVGPSSELSREAANPVPPHLRGLGTLIRTRPLPAARRGRASSPPRSVCASCSKLVVDLRMSGPCPRCLRPLCHDCLRGALATGGHGWCVDCSRAPVAG